MKILITGGSGQLAKSIASVYDSKKLIVTSKKDLDVTNRKKTLETIARLKPDIVFHFASLTRGEECAKNPEKARLINVKGTKNVADACFINDCELLFVSTNEVFDGKSMVAYSETDIPKPLTIAGKTKHKAEEIIKKRLRKYYIVRSSWLYSEWSNNFIHQVLNLVSNNKKIVLVDDEVSSPTYSLDLARAIKKLIGKKEYGIYHLNNTGKASRFEFAMEAIKIFGLNKDNITRIKLKDYPRLSKPPLHTPLENEKAAKIGIVMPRWKNALKRYLSTHKINKL